MKTITNLRKQNPRLQYALMKDGRGSLYLEYYLGRSQTAVTDSAGVPELYTEGRMKGRPKYKVRHIRKRVGLHLYILLSPRTSEDRSRNRETLALAEKIRYEREQEFLDNRFGYRLRAEPERDFMAFFRSQCDNMQFTRHIRVAIGLCYKRFCRFLGMDGDTGLPSLKAALLTAEMVGDFADYLKNRGTGEGPRIYFRHFKRVVTMAFEQGLLHNNPCRGVTVGRNNRSQEREILTPDEITRLLATHYNGEHREIRRAFAMSLFGGLRWSDVSHLTYGNVNYTARTLCFEQMKLRGRSRHSHVTLPLNDSLLQLIGSPTTGSSNQRIFQLPPYYICNRELKRWVLQAGISKNITWHCARHSFAVNLLNAGANLKTVSSLLGHASLQMTEAYIHAVDSLKQQAIDSLGPINFGVPQ